MAIINIKSRPMRWVAAGILALTINFLFEYFDEGSLQMKQIVKTSIMTAIVFIVVILIAESAAKNAPHKHTK